MKKATCQTCGGEFEYHPFVLADKEIFARKNCDACAQKITERDVLAQREKWNQQREREWERICPEFYRTASKPLITPLRIAIESWKYGGRGIGITGPSGIGKTIAAFRLLRKAWSESKSCAAISATRLCIVSAAQFQGSDEDREIASGRLRWLRKADCLLLDDLGKGRLTDRVEMELYDILEHRTSHCMPVIWTSNAPADALRSMMSEDRGEPIMRRLAQFSDVIAI